MLRTLYPLKHDPASPIGVMFSGGGARGAFQVGVWEVLSEHPRGLAGFPPAVISGTSAGAINGALIVAGLRPTELLEFWIGLAERPPVKANDRFFADLQRVLLQLAAREPVRGLARRGREARIAMGLFGKHRWYRQSDVWAMVMEFLLTARFDNISHLLDGIQASYLFDTSAFRERLREAIGGDTLPRSDIKLAINTVAIDTGSVLRIVNAEPAKRPQSAHHYLYAPDITLDMILASASIPLLFNPVEVEGKLLWDGGLLVNSPMAPAVALGARRIIPVLVTRGAGMTNTIEDFGHAIERLVDTFLENAYNVDRKLLLDRNVLASKLPAENLAVVSLFEAIRPTSAEVFNAGSYLYFEKQALIRMYQAGRVAAREWLSKGPIRDGRDKPDTFEARERMEAEG